MSVSDTYKARTKSLASIKDVSYTSGFSFLLCEAFHLHASLSRSRGPSSPTLTHFSWFTASLCTLHANINQQKHFAMFLKLRLLGFSSFWPPARASPCRYIDGWMDGEKKLA